MSHFRMCYRVNFWGMSQGEINPTILLSSIGQQLPWMCYHHTHSSLPSHGCRKRFPKTVYQRNPGQKVKHKAIFLKLSSVKLHMFQAGIFKSDLCRKVIWNGLRQDMWCLQLRTIICVSSCMPDIQLFHWSFNFSKVNFLCAWVINCFNSGQLFATLWTVVHQAPLSMGTFQAKILEWVVMPSSRGSSHLMDQTCISYVSCIGRQILYHSHHLGSPIYV